MLLTGVGGLGLAVFPVLLVPPLFPPAVNFLARTARAISLALADYMFVSKQPPSHRWRPVLEAPACLGLRIFADCWLPLFSDPPAGGPFTRTSER